MTDTDIDTRHAELLAELTDEPRRFVDNDDDVIWGTRQGWTFSRSGGNLTPWDDTAVRITAFLTADEPCTREHVAEWVDLTEKQARALPNGTRVKVRDNESRAPIEGDLREITTPGGIRGYFPLHAYTVGNISYCTVSVHPDDVPTDPRLDALAGALAETFEPGATVEDYRPYARALLAALPDDWTKGGE